ncbi:hypothetical protein ABZY68_31820 [Streptomyces sp. NPDC006482]|uniref:RICIN domain-containing protein n=1 Tax=Streptomyces sp. NPDC006482 TaxID=3154306 RepID=UPI00339DD892
MKKNRMVQAMVAAVAIPALALMTASPAAADGRVQWKHAQSGYCLNAVQGVSAVHTFWNCNAANGVWWTEIQNSDGSWNMVDQWGRCLTAYWQDQVYVENCSSGRDQTNWYQRWWEDSTSSGWKLTNRMTGRVLDSNGKGGDVYTLGNNDSIYQRWH